MAIPTLQNLDDLPLALGGGGQVAMTALGGEHQPTPAMRDQS